VTTASPRYADDIRPLFRESDRDNMEGWFDLWDWQDVREAAPLILERLERGEMPCDDPWGAEPVALFRRWLEAGCPA
jgi:hypothetical protein